MQGVLIHEPSPTDDYWLADDRRNVSKLHRELQHRAIRWLANRCTGCCYASVEVPFGFIQADALAFARPSVKFDSAISGDRFWQAMVVMFEAKASRSDFMATFGPASDSLVKLKPPGNYRYLVKPRKVEMPLELLPDGWGVLEASGRGLRVVTRAARFELKSLDEHVDALYAILHYGGWGKRQMFVACPDCAKVSSTIRPSRQSATPAQRVP